MSTMSRLREKFDEFYVAHDLDGLRAELERYRGPGGLELLRIDLVHDLRHEVAYRRRAAWMQVAFFAHRRGMLELELYAWRRRNVIWNREYPEVQVRPESPAEMAARTATVGQSTDA